MINTFSPYSPLFHPYHPPPIKSSATAPPPWTLFIEIDNGRTGANQTGLHVHGGVIKHLVKIIRVWRETGKRN